MVEIVEEPTVAPGKDGKPIEIQPYSRWPLPYRGSRYSLIERKIDEKRRLAVVWRYRQLEPIYHKDDEGNPTRPKNLLRSFRRVGKGRGSFRVSPHEEVITKVQENKGKWIPYYLGKLNGEWNFGHGIDLNPNHTPFSVWTGFPFNHGEYWAVWIREGAGSRLNWKYRLEFLYGAPKVAQHLYFNSVEEYPNLIQIFLDVRPEGGRLYVNEYGHVWMNLPNSAVGPRYENQIRSTLDDFMATFEGNKKLVYERLRGTGCWPIYLGHMDDFDHGEPPRTYFKDLSSYWRRCLGKEDWDEGEEDWSG